MSSKYCLISRSEFRSEGVQELHVVELIDNVVLKGLFDVTHGDRLFLVTLGGLRNELHAVLVELDDTLHHTNSLGEYTYPNEK